VGCNWKAAANKLESGEWQLGVKKDPHNGHVATKTSAGHPVHRKLSPKAEGYAKTQFERSICPRNILGYLRDHMQVEATLRDMYNLKKRLHRAGILYQNPVQELIRKLQEDQVCYNFEVDDLDRVTPHALANPASLGLLKANPDSLLMDCTYKTNRYHLPLLNIVGSTSLNLSFQVAVFFIRREREEDYTWALSTLRTWLRVKDIPAHRIIVTDRELALTNSLYMQFPESITLLCRWHVNKAVVAHCKPLYPRDPKDAKKPGPEFLEFYSAYVSVIESASENDYSAQLDRLRRIGNPNCVRYIEEQWLGERKERIVKYWVDQ
jgi:hypothetical protein